MDAFLASQDWSWVDKRLLNGSYIQMDYNLKHENDTLETTINTGVLENGSLAWRFTDADKKYKIVQPNEAGFVEISKVRRPVVLSVHVILAPEKKLATGTQSA